jgi:hypothetical protein
MNVGQWLARSDRLSTAEIADRLTPAKSWLPLDPGCDALFVTQLHTMHDQHGSLSSGIGQGDCT